jgi:hypothetical protein
MQAPGMFIEYLINGSVALLWLLPILKTLGLQAPKEAAVTALAVPGLYVIGMMVDFIGWFISLGYKTRIRKEMVTQIGLNWEQRSTLQPKLFIYAPDLAKSSEMRGSRDRIARGTFVNVVMTTVVLLILSPTLGINISRFMIMIIGLIVSALCGAMWLRFQRLAYSYELRSMVAVQEKFCPDLVANKQSD